MECVVRRLLVVVASIIVVVYMFWVQRYDEYLKLARV